VGLIVPCRGIDQGFAENIGAVLRQDYEDYHVIFVTEASDDPAYPVLNTTVSGIAGGQNFSRFL
jgi:cellulose synthase/poly-beta-1,6-N-acetylglucosamine synthase-like glycosyltransferase